jgi:hypothetical protein
VERQFGQQKEQKKALLQKKFLHPNDFSGAVFGVYNFINAFCMYLFNEYSNLDNNNVINSKL